jgi:hypothetical protein
LRTLCRGIIAAGHRKTADPVLAKAMRQEATILTALFTGLTALFAGFLWWETLTHDTPALKPSVDIYTGADPDTPPVGISITNSGPGPALIKSVTFFVDRKPVQDANEAGITYAKLSEAELD